MKNYLSKYNDHARLVSKMVSGKTKIVEEKEKFNFIEEFIANETDQFEDKFAQPSVSNPLDVKLESLNSNKERRRHQKKKETRKLKKNDLLFSFKHDNVQVPEPSARTNKTDKTEKSLRTKTIENINNNNNELTLSKLVEIKKLATMTNDTPKRYIKGIGKVNLSRFERNIESNIESNTNIIESLDINNGNGSNDNSNRKYNNRKTVNFPINKTSNKNINKSSNINNNSNSNLRDYKNKPSSININSSNHFNNINTEDNYIENKVKYFIVASPDLRKNINSVDFDNYEIDENNNIVCRIPQNKSISLKTELQKSNEKMQLQEKRLARKMRNIINDQSVKYSIKLLENQLKIKKVMSVLDYYEDISQVTQNNSVQLLSVYNKNSDFLKKQYMSYNKKYIY